MTPGPAGYEMVEELGRGATGTVYLARQVALDREVAIKRIVGGASSQDPETILRFERQARRLARLDHAGIVRVHELVRVGADLFLVMEHVPGVDLRRVMAERPPGPEVAAGTLRDIAAALDHAHERGVVHLDVKPSNVLVRTDGVIKVGDFGVAALLERQALARSGRPGAIGGLAYMAPELARGDMAVDRRADVYSLGVIAYELLVGTVPFPVDPSDPYATVRAQMEQQPPRPGGAGVPPLLEAALLWALEKAPERRPATAGELTAALRDGLDRSPTIGAYTGEGRPGRSRPAAVGARPASPAGARQEPARGRWRAPLAVVLAGVLVGTAIVAAAGLLRPSPPPPPLAVTGVTAASDPADGSGHCPGASLTLRATVATNGMPGTITYEWLRPDGPPSGGGRLAVRGGQRSATVTTGVAYGGSVPAQGVAALHVLSPASVYSPPLRLVYTCP